jgi:hypothetical protein
MPPVMRAAFRSSAVAGFALAAACQPDPAPEPEPTPAEDSHPFSAGPEALCESPAPPGLDRFSDEAELRGIRPDLDQSAALPPGWPLQAGLVVMDGDGDRDLDLFFAQPAALPQVFANGGGGYFVEIPQDPQPLSQFGPAPGASIAMADIVGPEGPRTPDGLPDLLLLASRLVLVSENLGDLRFAPPVALYQAPAGDVGSTLSVALGDADGDGDLDLVLPGMDAVGEHPEPGPPRPAATRLLLQQDFGWSLAAELLPGLPPGSTGFAVAAMWTDRDGDGDRDLLLPSYRGGDGDPPNPPSAFFRNDGGFEPDAAPSLIDDAAALGAALPLSAAGLDTADLSGDGLPDFCLTDAGGVRCLVSSGSADAGWSDEAVARGLLPPDPVDVTGDGVVDEWNGISFDFNDFDNDGRLDAVATGALPLADAASGPGGGGNGGGAEGSGVPAALWHGLADGTFEANHGLPVLAEIASQHALVSADLDGDGFLEILTSGPSGGAHALWNRCGDGDWLQIELAGPWAEPLAFGARVQVEPAAGAPPLVREVHGPRGLGQAPTRLHFGLGESLAGASSVAAVRVRWPDGTETVSRNVPVRRLVTIPHPARIYGDDEGSAADDDDSTQWGDDDGAPASLSGTVTRGIDATGDAAGPLFVGLFDADPALGGAQPVVVQVQSVDLLPEGASASYQLLEIPTRDAPYWLVAYLDDDGSGVMTGPTAGDLVASGGGTGIPQVPLAEAGEHQQDLLLDAVYGGR